MEEEYKLFIGCPKGIPVEAGGGIGSETSNEELFAHFSQFGEVIKVIQLKHPNGTKKGCGYIQFSSLPPVEECSRVENHMIGGRPMVSSKAKNRDELRALQDKDPRDMGRKRGFDQGGSWDGSFQKRMRKDIEHINLEGIIMRKLIVSGLPVGTSADEIREYFNTYGVVESCEVGKTKTGQPRGFCFMVFEKASSVDEIQLARPHYIGGKEVTTKRYVLEDDKINDNVSSKKIFVGSPNNFSFKQGTGGLNEEISDDDLKDYFGQFGVVTDVMQLYHNDTGRHKGVGFVYFEDEDAVDKIVLIGAHIIKNRVLETSKALGDNKSLGKTYSDQRKPTDPKSRAMRRLFVRGIADSMTLDSVKDYFNQYGEIVDADIPFDKKRGKRAAFGFLTFSSMDEVDDCMKNRPHTLDGKDLTVRRAMDNETPELASCLKVFLGSPGGKSTSTGGLTDDVTDDDLREYFGQFGTLTHIKQIRDKNTNKHKGVAFLEYEDVDAVDKVVLLAIHELKGRILEATKALSDNQRKEKDLKEREKKMMDMERMMGSQRGNFGGRGGMSRMYDGNFDYQSEAGFGGMGFNGGYNNDNFNPMNQQNQMGNGGFRGRGSYGGRGRGGRGGFASRGRGGRGGASGSFQFQGQTENNLMGNNGINQWEQEFMKGGGGKPKPLMNVNVMENKFMNSNRQMDNMGNYGPGNDYQQQGMGMGAGPSMMSSMGQSGYNPMGASNMSQMGGNAASQGRKLLINGLKPYMNEQMMSKYFQKFGELVDWGRDMAGGGDVVYSNPSMAEYCVRMQNHNIDGNEIYVVKAKTF